LYNGNVFWPVVKKLLILGVLLVATVYLFGWEGKIKEWFSRSQVLGERSDLGLEERFFQPAREAIDQHVRWPRQEDLEPLPKIVVNEDSQEGSPSSASLDQSLEDLAQEIKDLPQQQLIKIKEQLIKEIFPDCECSCSIIKDDNN
jgi:hypothetical protein